MSYEIYYDRAFIRIGDMYIPMVNQGSNNCFEYDYFSHRDIPEKSWQVLNWQHRSQLLFTAEEVRWQAVLYEGVSQRQGMCYKTRNTAFAPGEFGRWIANGMNNAYTIEEYVSFGNTPFIDDYSSNDRGRIRCFRTTEEFLALLEQREDATELNVGFCDRREVYRPVKRRPKPKPADYQAMPEYFVLKFDLGYFSRWRKTGFVYTYDATVNSARKFLKESDAAKYLVKYQDRFARPFAVERVVPLKKAGVS